MSNERKPLVLCPHQANSFRLARNIGPTPVAWKDMDDDMLSYIHGLRVTMALALDCLLGRRLTTECETCDEIARLIADTVLERRGPEITEHDAYSLSLRNILDEVPCDEDH